jgi:GNAT superfamily N-acetyltransferase
MKGKSSGMDHFLSGLKTWLEATESYVAKKVDPALMTWDEFWQLVNPQYKSHSSDAYDYSLEDYGMQHKKEDYPTLLFRRKISGITFEFRLKKEDRYQWKFVKTDQDGEPVRINGELQYYTPEELERFGKQRYAYSFAVFDGDQQVALAQDEWGCLLFAVAREYRGFGLGPMLAKIAWEAEPGKDTGGCTPGGAATTKKAYQEFVRDYLKKGFYSYLVREGLLTAEKVKAIIASAKLSPPKENSRVDLGTNDPKDLLLYAENGHFILYNRKLKDLLDQGDEEHYYYWYEKCIKGTSFAGGGYATSDRLFLHQLGGDTPNIKKFMFNLALSYCRQENVPLHVYNDDIGLVDPATMEVNGNLVTLKTAPIDYRAWALQEKTFRRSFDRYQEFKSRLLELAEVKYR